ncbi:MAG: cold shock domain-containing protein, partial [Alphaproteobacteria bacterium]|nr:cold shock domain-containing protein [Alphaproteobacteria bacterium]
TAIVSNVMEATNNRDLTTILVTGDRDIGPTIEPLWRAGKKLHLLFVENEVKLAVNFSSRIRQTANECGFACHGWSFADISKIFTMSKTETPQRQEVKPVAFPGDQAQHDTHNEYGQNVLNGQTGSLLQFHGRDDVIHPDRGFGFLRPDKIPADGVERIFIHFSSLAPDTDYHELRPGTRVEFTASKGELGWQATHVRPLPGQNNDEFAHPGLDNQMGVLLQFHGRDDVIHPERGFGFLKPDSAPEMGVEKIFVHFSAFPRDIDYRTLKPGMRVGFSAKKVDQRWNATKVDLLYS